MAAQNNPVPNADKHPCLPHTAIEVLEICRSAYLCYRAPLKGPYTDLITTYFVCNWADVKSKEFSKLVHLVEQLFCMASTSAPFEKKY